MIFQGVLPAVLTPYGPDGSVHAAALREHVDWLIDAGVHGIVGVGSMGDFSFLTPEERRNVTRLLIEAANGRVPVTIGISASTAADARAFATFSVETGAQSLMCLPPTSYAADAREVFEFFHSVASATDLPLMIYNNPEAGRTDLMPEMIARLFAIDGIAGVKESSGDPRRVAAILLLTANEMDVLVGGDDWPLEGLCAGASGWVSGCANVQPAECVELFKLCKEGKVEAARSLSQRLLPLGRLDQAKVVQFHKAALSRIGRYGGPNRPPRLELTEDEARVVDSALRHLRGGG